MRNFLLIVSDATKVILVLLGATFLFLAESFAEASCGLRLTFVDVGEGDSLIIEQAGSAPVILDTGNPVGGLRVASILKRRGVEKLAAIIVTHPHLDHAAGVFTLLDRFSTEKLYDNGQDTAVQSEGNDMYRWYSQHFRQNDRYSELRAGSSLQIGAASMTALWPPRGELNTDWNHNSLVFMLRYGHFRALLMGDALESTERGLLASGVDLHSRVLKVGHHGSKYASSEAFLARAQPKLAILSVNSENVRGYPSDKTTKRLSGVTRMLRTDRNGTITVCAAADGNFTVSTERTDG